MTSGERFRGRKARGMDLHHGTLTGALEQDPITRGADHGTPQVRLTLRRTDAGPAGQAGTRCVPCAAYAPAGAQAGELSAGEPVLVAGTRTWTSWTDKQGQKRRSLVVGPHPTRVSPGAIRVKWR